MKPLTLPPSLRGGQLVQGDIGKSMVILQATDRCEADRIEQQDDLKC